MQVNGSAFTGGTSSVPASNEIERKEQELSERVAQNYSSRTAEREERLRRIAEVGVMEAAGLPSAIRRAAHMTVAEGRTLEAVTNQNDSDQINFLDRGFRAGKAVCRLLLNREPLGTGFLVAPGLLMTNNHVLAEPETAAVAIAEFNYQLDADDNPLTPHRFTLQPTQIFVTSPMTELDYTLVAVSPVSVDGSAVTGFGWLPLDSRIDKVLEGEPVVIIQHPQGREKRICLFDSVLIDRFDRKIQYTTDTEPGSSGSPAFNRHWQVIALHHASAKTDRLHKGAPVVVNEGIRISAILGDLQAREQSQPMTRLALQLITAPGTVGTGRPAPVSSGSPGAGANPVASNEAAKTRIRTRPASFYADRKGYDPEFLGRGALRVPLPGLTPALLEDTSTLADGTVELKYTHYSALMCKSRRMAWFSAANIDGAALQSLSRTDRKAEVAAPAESIVQPEAAADVWYFDPRIPEADQTGAAIYDGTDFDFGHITRRLDPVWGELRTARMANDDTFHMTNCAPQHRNLNQVIWAALENTIYDTAKRARAKLTVISGPVLDPRDPVILGVAIPLAYWKVVAWTDRSGAGPLRAMGFIRWQTRLVDQVRDSLEAIRDELVKAKPVSIRDLARITSLDFGPLIRADLAPGRKLIPELLTEATVPELFANVPELAGADVAQA